MQGSARDAWFYLVDAAQHGDDGKSWWPLSFGGKVNSKSLAGEKECLNSEDGKDVQPRNLRENTT
uniref:OSJNBa0032N05.23 protein n=1 Tax=Oryza sativa subsp. japonica TaxID=39947 RepID=Q5CAH5_ORYSJ|nr:OSJNBa0032N05.23 [Oryza sativa Japonica Group]